MSDTSQILFLAKDYIYEKKNIILYYVSIILNEPILIHSMPFIYCSLIISKTLFHNNVDVMSS